MPQRPFIIPVFVPHLGCPHRCLFCNQKSITGHGEGEVSARRVRARISEFLAFKGAHRGSVEVAFYGGNFLGLPASYRKTLLDEAQRFVSEGKVGGIRFSTRPDTVSDQTIGPLAPYAIRAVELGAQSMDDQVLALSRRGHRAEDTVRSVRYLKSEGLAVGLQIMPGLPGDSRESMLQTGRRVAELRPDFVRIYPTIVVKDTMLANWYHAGRFEPLTLRQAIEITKDLYALFVKNRIVVIRMGLQAGASLLEPGTIIAGPFHPCFGHMVYSRFFRDLVVQRLEKQKGLRKIVVLRVSPGDVPKAIGYRRENIRVLAKRFDLGDIRVIGDPAVARDTVQVGGLTTQSSARPLPEGFA